MKPLTTALLLLALAAHPAQAAVNVNRSGSENPMVEVSRSTIYGGITGLVLGGALAMATDGGSDASYLKWGFVGGTFFGFAYGLYHVQSRPHALLEVGGQRVAWSVPEPALARDGTVRVSLLSTRF
jgi:hypothetical protein